MKKAGADALAYSRPITGYKNKKLKLEVLKHIYLILVSFLIIYPLILMAQMSIKDSGQILFEFFAIKAPFHFENYVRAWGQISPLILNSLIMSGGSMILAVAMASLAAYAFGKMSFPGREILFWVVFAKMFLPGIINLVPQFILAWKLGLLDTYWAVILFQAAVSQSFWVFVLRTFIAQQPKDLFEASRIDGANEFQAFRLIAVPLLRPMLVLMGINVFIGEWNDYIWPLVSIQTKSMQPITVGLSYLTSSFPGDFGPLTAGYTIASIPLLILFFLGMRQFIEGLTAGAIKL